MSQLVIFSHFVEYIFFSVRRNVSYKKRTFYRILSKYIILKKSGSVGSSLHFFIYLTYPIFDFFSSVRIDQGNYVVTSCMASKSNTKRQHHHKNVWKRIATLLIEIEVDTSWSLDFSSKGESNMQVATRETVSSVYGLLWVCFLVLWV